jgi:hypothetical protein
MRGVWTLLAILVGCEPGVDDLLDTASQTGDTGVFEVEARATGGQAPGLARTAEQPLSTFSLDGRNLYDGIAPPIPTDRAFALETQLTHGNVWRLDVGIRAGALARNARNVGVQLAFNPQAVRRYELRGATGSGYGIEPERIMALEPGALRGATFDLEPLRKTAGAATLHRGFLGTVTISWTEGGHSHQEVVVLEAPR